MSYINLSGKRGQGKQTLVDESTFKKWGGLKWHLSDTGYAIRRNNHETVRLHRLVVNAPEGMIVDHLNGDRLDNRLSNLRICTQLENMANVHGSKGYTFSKDKNLWLVRYRRKFYGYYKTEGEAARAYSLAISGVEKESRLHPLRKYLPKGVYYMKNNKNKKYYINPMVKGKRYFQGFFSTIQEAEDAHNKFLNKEE